MFKPRNYSSLSSVQRSRCMPDACAKMWGIFLVTPRAVKCSVEDYECGLSEKRACY